MKKNIPNILTLGNLLCGCIGITMALKGHLSQAAYLIWLAAIFDFLDGMAARMLKVSSHIGKELDSLADMTSFGILPSILMYVLIQESSDSIYLPYVAFIIALLSALRLARFNVDTRQSYGFVGLPTPANALFISALALIVPINDLWSLWLGAQALAVLSIIMGLLLVLPVKLLAVKFQQWGWKDNQARYVFIIGLILLLILGGVKAIPLALLWYLVCSFTHYYLLKNN